MFLDRKDVTELIRTKLTESKSVFLFSPIGIGKTALCAEVLKPMDSTVIIKHRNCENLFNDGDIIIQLYEELNRNANLLKINSYKEFSKSLWVKNTFFTVISSIDNFSLDVDITPILHLGIPIIYLLKGVIRLFIPRRVRDSWAELKNNKTNLVRYKKYINHVFNERKDLIVNINNLQTIDKISFDYIVEAIQKYHIRFLLEYTEDQIEGISYYENNFTGLLHQIFPLHLENLPILEAKQLLEKYCPENKRQQAYEQFLKTGNLYPIVTNEIAEAEINLNVHEKTLIYITVQHNNSIKSEVLRVFFSTITGLGKRESKRIINQLIDKKILFKENKELHVIDFYFKINQTIKMSIFIKLKELFKKDYYNKSLLQILLPLYIEFDIDGLIDFMPQIRTWVLQIAEKQKAENLLTQITNKIDDNVQDRESLILFIIDIYYSMTLFKEAYDVLLKFKKPNIKFYIYEAMLLNRMDLHEKSNKVIRAINKNLSKQEEIILLNIEMINYASLRQSNKIIDSYNKMLSIKGANQYYEYNYTLRNSHLAVDRPKAIENLRKCIKNFHRNNDPKNESRALISLSILLILNGDLKKAEDMLVKANELSSKHAYELSVSYNNLATIYMEREQYIEAEKYLLDAAALSFDLFDKLSILGNLLTVKTQTQDIEEGKEIAKSIIEIIDLEPDKKLKSCLYNELSEFFRQANDVANFKKYYELSVLMLEEISTDRKTTNQAVTSHNGFIINQLAFWHFDLFQIIKKL